MKSDYKQNMQLRGAGFNLKTPICPVAFVHASFLFFLVVGNQRLFVSLQDTVIYDRLADSSKYKEITLKHLEQFATEGEWVNIAPCL